MKASSISELIEKMDSILTKNRGLLSEEDFKILENCKKKLEELNQAQIKENFKLRNSVISEAISLLLKFFLSDL